MKWTIDSWQNYPIKQVPTYNDGNELKNVEDELSFFLSFHFFLFPYAHNLFKEDVSPVESRR